MPNQTPKNQKQITLILPKPHEGQLKVIRESRRFNVLACGRRFGKTTLGINELVQPALEGYPAAWFSPIYRMLNDVWRDAVIILHPVIKRISTQEKRIELITGGVLDFWSLDNPNAGRGKKYKRIAVDEAAMVPKLKEAWQEAIRPTLSDYEGDGWFFSTPKGMDFFKEMFDWGQDPLRPEWASWQMPTITNPYIKPSEIEAARLELPELAFKQEYLAEFLQGEGTVFRNIKAVATQHRLQPYKGRFVAGVDWGRQNDYTVIRVLDADKRIEVDADRFNKIDWHFQRERIKTMHKKWGIQQIWVENNSIGNPNFEALLRENLPVFAFDTTQSSKPPLIESLALAFEREEIKTLNDPVFIAELEAFERKISPMTGRSSYSAPEGQHDDTVIALALAWHATGKRTSQPAIGSPRPPITPNRY